MKLVLLGTCGYHPTDDRQTMCVMLPELGIVLDAGTGMFRVREHLQTATLDILLSHAHLDHIVGLTFLLNILCDDDLEPRTMQHVRVHGVAEKLDAVREHMFSEHLFPIMPPIEWCPLVQSLKLDGDTTVTWFPLQHSGGSVGYRLDWPDRSMAYVTDTTAREDADYIKHIRGVDLLIHESYLPAGWETRAAQLGHSSLGQVARLARAAGVGKLVVAHFNPLKPLAEVPDIADARRIFPGTCLGIDQMEIVF